MNAAVVLEEKLTASNAREIAKILNEMLSGKRFLYESFIAPVQQLDSGISTDNNNEVLSVEEYGGTLAGNVVVNDTPDGGLSFSLMINYGPATTPVVVKFDPDGRNQHSDVFFKVTQRSVEIKIGSNWKRLVLTLH